MSTMDIFEASTQESSDDDSAIYSAPTQGPNHGGCITQDIISESTEGGLRRAQLPAGADLQVPQMIMSTSASHVADRLPRREGGVGHLAAPPSSVLPVTSTSKRVQPNESCMLYPSRLTRHPSTPMTSDAQVHDGPPVSRSCGVFSTGRTSSALSRLRWIQGTDPHNTLNLNDRNTFATRNDGGGHPQRGKPSVVGVYEEIQSYQEQSGPPFYPRQQQQQQQQQQKLGQTARQLGDSGQKPLRSKFNGREQFTGQISADFYHDGVTHGCRQEGAVVSSHDSHHFSSRKSMETDPIPLRASGGGSHGHLHNRLVLARGHTAGAAEIGAEKAEASNPKAKEMYHASVPHDGKTPEGVFPAQSPTYGRLQSPSSPTATLPGHVVHTSGLKSSVISAMEAARWPVGRSSRNNRNHGRQHASPESRFSGGIEGRGSRSKQQRQRGATSTSVKDDLFDALSAGLKEDNRERFRMERAARAAAQGIAATESAATYGEHSGEGMMWVRGGALLGRGDGNHPQPASPSRAEDSVLSKRSLAGEGLQRTPSIKDAGESAHSGASGCEDRQDQGDAEIIATRELDNLLQSDTSVLGEYGQVLPQGYLSKEPGGGKGGGSVPNSTQDESCVVSSPQNLGSEAVPQKFTMSGAATAPWERHTRGFGSRMLRRMGFDGTTGAQATEIATTAASKARVAMDVRGGKRGGLGYVRSIMCDDYGPCTSAPSDMDFGRCRSNPSPVYSGVTVHFPYEAPMKPQDQLMQRVIAALKKKKHALLESPTGTGKSAALLCSTLAWQRHELIRTGKAPQIIYGARTHTQLTQMAGELKKSPYRPTMAILGSRKQLCIHPTVSGYDLAAGEDTDSGEGGGEYDQKNTQHPSGRLSSQTTLNGWKATSGSPEKGQVGGVMMEEGFGKRRSSTRTKPQPSTTLKSMQEMCHDLRKTVEEQRKEGFLRTRSKKERQPYNYDAPDLRLDFDAISDRLTAEEKAHAGCPYYRAMSARAYASLTHELTRPAVGLANGSDGIWDLEDLRGFGRDPRGFVSKKQGEWAVALAQRTGTTTQGESGPCQSSSTLATQRQAPHRALYEQTASSQLSPSLPSPQSRQGQMRTPSRSNSARNRSGGEGVTPRGVAGCGGSKARSGLGNTGIDGSAGIGSSTCGSQCGVARLNNPRSASTTASARPLSVPVIDLSYDDDDEEGDGTGGQSSNFELGRELSGVSDFGNGATSRARRAEERWKRGKAMGGEEDSPTALAAAALDESATAEGQKEPVTDGAACPPEDSKTRVLGCPYFTAQVLACQAQLLLVPYNYILDPQIRKATSVSIENNVVVLDEAHNIESVCREAGSLELSVIELGHLASSLCHLSTVEQMREEFSAFVFLTYEITLPTGIHKTVLGWMRAIKPGDEEKLQNFCDEASFLLKFVKHLTEFAATESETLEDFEEGRTCDLPLGTAAEEKRLKGQRMCTVQKWAFDSAGTCFWRDLTQNADDYAHYKLSTALETLQAKMRELNSSDFSLGYLEQFLFVIGLVLRRPHDFNINVIAWDNVTHKPLPDRCRHRHLTTRYGGSKAGEYGLLNGGTNAVPARLFQLNIWLMAPGVVFNDVARQAHSVILTSGTLSPLDSFRAELGQAFHKDLLPFPQQALEADHVVTPGRQLEVLAVSFAPPPVSIKLKCTKRNLDDGNFMREVGRTVVRLCEHVPSGVLVFLPSYSCLREAVSTWRGSEVWAELERLKGTIVEEPESAKEFKAAKRHYEAAIDAQGGGGKALLLAVYRGKMSEGISFNDHYARGVLCVGIPYPSAVDPKVTAKRRYNNWKANNIGWDGENPLVYRGRGGERRWDDIVRAAHKALAQGSHTEADLDAVAGTGQATLTGEAWYTQQAFRALNQALGRCIRHVHDYGVVCLVDSRHSSSTGFGTKSTREYLARWMRGLVRSVPSLEMVASIMDELFAGAPAYIRERKEGAMRARSARIAAVENRRRKRSGNAIVASSPASETRGSTPGAIAVEHDATSRDPAVRHDVGVSCISASAYITNSPFKYNNTGHSANCDSSVDARCCGFREDSDDNHATPRGVAPT